MENELFDIIIIGSGMGGLSAGACLVSRGLNVLVLEKAAIPGGCSSSYKKNDAVFESGATTLIGFDQHQPLRRLEEITGLNISKEALSTSMRVHQANKFIDRSKDFNTFLIESIKFFGFESQQKAFWNKISELNKLVWEVSEQNVYFPPNKLEEWVEAVRVNKIRNIPSLRYLFKSTADAIEDFGITSSSFKQFIDQQLMITAQSTTENVPFLFAAPALFYPHSTNYYVRGGLWKMIYQLTDYIKEKGGDVQIKQEVSEITKEADQFVVKTRRRKEFKAKCIVLNVPIWNAAQIVNLPETKEKLLKASKQFERSWGAFTMGIVTKDVFESDSPLHHQIHFDDPILGGKGSIFVSLSKSDDEERNPQGCRVANISTHTEVDKWFIDKESYDQQKNKWEEQILTHLGKHFEAFQEPNIMSKHSATPRTWQKWVGRSLGKVGGIPQSMDRSVLSWPPTHPEKGIYLVGDTTYPGQGIPGVTLSGINVYIRILKEINSNKAYLS